MSKAPEKGPYGLALSSDSLVESRDTSTLLWRLRVDAQQNALRASLGRPPQVIAMDARSSRGDDESTELVIGSLTTCDVTSAVAATNVVRRPI